MRRTIYQILTNGKVGTVINNHTTSKMKKVFLENCFIVVAVKQHATLLKMLLCGRLLLQLFSVFGHLNLLS